MQYWITGRTQKDGWEILGLFDAEEKAIARCSELRDFIAPLTLNESICEETKEWPGCRFPLLSIDNYIEANDFLNEFNFLIVDGKEGE